MPSAAINNNNHLDKSRNDCSPSSGILPPLTFSPEEEAVNERRNQLASMLAEKLTECKMLAHCCPNEFCYGTPMLQSKKDGRTFCVGCDDLAQMREKEKAIRNRRDELSKMVSEKMLQSCCVLNKHCDQELCYDCVLLRSVEGREFCVGCDDRKQKAAKLGVATAAATVAAATLPTPQQSREAKTVGGGVILPTPRHMSREDLYNSVSQSLKATGRLPVTSPSKPIIVATRPLDVPEDVAEEQDTDGDLGMHDISDVPDHSWKRLKQLNQAPKRSTVLFTAGEATVFSTRSSTVDAVLKKIELLNQMLIDAEMEKVKVCVASIEDCYQLLHKLQCEWVQLKD